MRCKRLLVTTFHMYCILFTYFIVYILIACVCQEFCPRGGGGLWSLGRHPLGRHPRRADPPGSRHPLEKTSPRSRHSPLPGSRQPPIPWEQTSPPPGVDPTPGTVYAGRYGQQAGGTHPTGMNTCLEIFQINKGQNVLN